MINSESAYKQEDLSIMMPAIIQATRNVSLKEDNPRPYQCIECGSGDGTGTTRVLLDCLKPYNSIFVGLEKDPVIFESLIENVDIYVSTQQIINCSTQLYRKDYNEFLPNWGCQIGGSSPMFGLCFIDVDGLPLLDGLIKLFQNNLFRRFDIMMYYPAGAHKRCLKSPKCRLNRRLAEELKPLGKNYWFVREPRGSYQWTFLYGTQWSIPLCKNLYRIDDGDKGEEIFHRLNYTYEELSEEKEDRECLLYNN